MSKNVFYGIFNGKIKTEALLPKVAPLLVLVFKTKTAER